MKIGRGIVFGLMCLSVHIGMAQNAVSLKELLREFPNNNPAVIRDSVAALKKIQRESARSDHSLFFKSSYYLAQNARSKSNSRLAKQYLNQCIRTHLSKKEYPNLAYAYFDLGQIFFDEGAFDASLTCYLKAQVLFKNRNDYFYANTFTAIGDLYLKMNAYTNALNYFQISLKLKKQNPDWVYSLAYNYWCIAEAKYGLKELDSAMYFYKLSGKWAEKTRGYSYYANEGIARILINRGKFDTAIDSLNSILTWYKNSDVPLWLSDMGLLYMEVYLKQEKQELFSKWSDFTREHVFREYLPEQQRRFYQLNASFYEKQGELKIANKYLEKVNESWSQIDALRGTSRIDSMMVAYHVLREKNTVLELESRLKSGLLRLKKNELHVTRMASQKRILFLCILSLGVIACGAVFLAYYINQQKKQVLLAKKRLDTKEQRIREMQLKSAQPFGLFNSDFQLLEQNEGLLDLLKPEKTDQLVNLLDHLPSVKGIELTELVAGLNPFENVHFQWVLDGSGELKAIDFTIIHLLEDPSVEAYLLEGKDRTSEYLQEQRVRKELQTKIREREEDLIEVSNDVALSHLLLESKNKTLQEIASKLEDFNELGINTSQLKQILYQDEHQERFWLNFVRYFDRAHEGFFKKLNSRHPGISLNDEKHCAYLRMRFNNKEVALIMGISVDSVKKARQRLKKKLSLEPEKSLNDYLYGL
jgi:tetratricopeptide (TPR) repeat protein